MIMSGWEERSSDVPHSSTTPPIQSNGSKSANVVSFDDLPDLLLVEIICRLPSKEFVFQCKCVSNRWLNLISDQYFIGRFLHIQRFHKKTPVARSLIDINGKEFIPAPRGTKPPSSNHLDPLLKRLMSFYGLEEKPYAVATSNDLVLCCRTHHKNDQREFYICNPCTRQWIALPPTTRSCRQAPVGFVCDRYYEEEDSTTTDDTSNTINIKKDYRCKVVRILPHGSSTMPWRYFTKFIVQVFCFKTGEWRESIVSSPRSISIGTGDPGVYYNGMLYWRYKEYDCDQIGLIRLDPFMISNGSAGNGSPNGDETVDDDQYQFRLFEAVDEYYSCNPRMWVYRGRLQMWACRSDNEFVVWELTGDDDDLGSSADNFDSI